jgi:catechol 2,3-dioxygenase-like lactoylglutathione lyase family enzyme
MSLALAIPGAALLAQPAVPPLADEHKLIRVSGLALNVTDVERSRAFYMDVLGLQVDARVPAEGEASEYLLGQTGVLREDTLVVLTRGDPQPGATTFGRLTVVVPNGRTIAERAAAAGYQVRGEIRDGTNFILDPDGYLVELYQRPN